MIYARCALLEGGWCEGVRLTLSEGRIDTVLVGAMPQPGDARVDVLLPALSNLHSHAFQRAMAGRTEVRAAGRESFWTWREAMYRFVSVMTPDQMQAVAAMAYVEMLEAGFAAVGEFHYLHHAPAGQAYDDPAEMSARIMAAASAVGIGLTHLPVLYSYGGAGRVALGPAQARFGNDVSGFARLLEGARLCAAGMAADTVVGIAPHSLRATCPEDLAAVLPLAQGGPVHIHVAEQPKEVADISAWLRARPVEWLLDNVALGPNWCAIHATHMTADEVQRLARSGTVAGLCPITEANLGDGPFDGPGWLAGGGALGVGSDSNVRISVAEELRMLDYSQRLRDLSRTVMVPGAGSVGAYLYGAAARGGARALGRQAGVIAAGQWGDLMALEGTHPALAGLSGDQILDGFAFAAPDGVISDVWSAGRHQVRAGRHVARDQVRADYGRAISSLLGAM